MVRIQFPSNAGLLISNAHQLQVSLQYHGSAPVTITMKEDRQDSSIAAWSIHRAQRLIEIVCPPPVQSQTFSDTTNGFLPGNTQHAGQLDEQKLLSHNVDSSLLTQHASVQIGQGSLVGGNAPVNGVLRIAWKRKVRYFGCLVVIVVIRRKCSRGQSFSFLQW